MGNGCTSYKAVQTAEALSLPTIKLVVVGETACGKTSIVARYEKNHFHDKYEPTKVINIVSVVKKVNIPDQSISTLELWDVPDHEDIDLRKTYYLNADAIVVVVDISDPDALDCALKWKQDAFANVRHTKSAATFPSVVNADVDNQKSRLEQFKPKPGSVPVLLLGNKFDIAKEHFLREQYLLYDGLSSKVTFDLSAKQNDVNEDSALSVTNNEDANHDTIDKAVSLAKSAESPKLDKINDNDTDQGIVVDTNADEDSLPAKAPQLESNAAEEDQGIVADKEDTPSSNDESPNLVKKNDVSAAENNATTPAVESSSSAAIDNSVDSAKSGAEVKEESKSVVPVEDKDTNEIKDKDTNEIKEKDTSEVEDKDTSEVKNKDTSEVEDKDTNEVEDIGNNEAQDNDTNKVDVNNANDNASKNQQNSESVVVEKKKSMDSGVEIKETQSSAEVTTGVTGADVTAEDQTEEKKPKKLKKLFLKDLAAQNEEESVTESSTQPLHEVDNAAEKSEPKKEVPLATNGGSVVTMSTFAPLPPCVDALERFAEEHGFIAGIPVSAKDAKGGVHEALQSLVRHLVVKMKQRNGDRRSDEVSVRSQLSAAKRARRRQPNPDIGDFETLQEVGIVEIDETLRKCNAALKQAEELTTGYRAALHDLKRVCRKKNLVEGSSVSVEECIAALKQVVESPLKTSNERSEIRAALLTQENQTSFSLVASDDDDDFILLQIVDGNNQVINTADDVREKLLVSKDALSVLNLYQEKVYPSCCAVVESAQHLEQVLSQFCDKIASQEEMAWDVAVAAGHSQAKVRHILSLLAQGKARMRGTLEQLKDTRRSVNGTKARIRAALLF